MTLESRSQGLSLLVDEERAEAAEWRRHADAPTPASRSALFTRYHGFARKLAISEWHRLGKIGLGKDDCEQLANEALLQSLDRFDPHAGTPFTAFARIRIRGAIRNGLSKATEATALYSARKRIERDRLRSLKQQADTPSKEPLELLREVAVGIALGFMLEEAGEAGLEQMPSGDPSAYDAVSWNQLVKELGQRLQGLPEREKAILEYHYKQDVQFTDIANLMGLSKGRISQLHSQALQRLRATLSKFR